MIYGIDLPSLRLNMSLNFGCHCSRIFPILNASSTFFLAPIYRSLPLYYISLKYRYFSRWLQLHIANFDSRFQFFASRLFSRDFYLARSLVIVVPVNLKTPFYIILLRNKYSIQERN